jgi:NTP pyrophosphatase (non-canonical NTP hydrolase)
MDADSSSQIKQTQAYVDEFKQKLDELLGAWAKFKTEQFVLTSDAYQAGALRTESKRVNFITFGKDGTCSTETYHHLNPRLLHGILGLMTEVGELTDQLKKHIFYGAPLDEKNIFEELGDILWYVALTAAAIDHPLSEVMAANLRKLRVRFPECFTEQLALERNIDAELKEL